MDNPVSQTMTEWLTDKRTASEQTKLVLRVLTEWLRDKKTTFEEVVDSTSDTDSYDYAFAEGAMIAYGVVLAKVSVLEDEIE